MDFVQVTQNDDLGDLFPHFKIEYLILTSKKFRITVQPNKGIFMLNTTFKFQTKNLTAKPDLATNFYPFRLTNYGKKNIFTIKGYND